MDKYISSIENTFNNLQEDLDYVLPILKDNKKCKQLENNSIIDITDISYIMTLVTDLSVQLQDIRIKIESLNLTNSRPITNDDDDIKNNPLLPLFLLFAMIKDPNSILNSNTFGKKDNNQNFADLDLD